MFHVKHFRRMDKELQKKIRTFNRRINTMIEYSDDNLDSIDQARQGLKMVYGNSMRVPHATIKGLSSEKIEQLESVMDAYLNNYESTIPSYKAVLNKGFKGFADKRGLSTQDVVKYNKIFRSSEFQKIKELNYFGSDDVVDNIDSLIDNGYSGKEVVDLLSNYIKGDKTKTFREWVDDIVYNTGEELK